MAAISREYIENDPRVQELKRYMYSDEFKSAWNIFYNSPEVVDIVEWMKHHGVDIDQELLAFTEKMNQLTPQISDLRAKRSADAAIFSIQSFKDELKAQVKFDEINALISKLIHNGNDFTQLFLIFKVSQPALEKLFEAEEIEIAMMKLDQFGVDTQSIKSSVYEMLRWQ